MNRIDKFQIISLTMKCFKGFSEEETFDFGPLTFISGGNEKGKTSIAEGIAYALTGVSFYGGKSLDHLQNDKGFEMEVTVKICDQNGEIHEITRGRKKNTSELSFNGYKISQTYLTEAFAEKDLFFSMFNPEYFIEVLGKDGEKPLKSCCLWRSMEL